MGKYYAVDIKCLLYKRTDLYMSHYILLDYVRTNVEQFTKTKIPNVVMAPIHQQIQVPKVGSTC